MLTLITGRAGCGKTSYIYNRVKALVDARQGNNIIIVPEQYSHDAERLLCAACGDSVSLYAEVLSFSRLCNRVFSQTGGMSEKMLDDGGLVLAMSLAMSRVSPQLKVYNVGRRRPDFIKSLISEYDELRSARIENTELSRIADDVNGIFSDKLNDLSLIFEAYDLIKEKSGCDAQDKIARLAENIGKSTIGDSGTIFIDGFTDFTAQEFDVIAELMKKDADIVVCLTCGRLDDRDLLFRLTVKTANHLIAEATRNGIKTKILHMTAENNDKGLALAYLEKNLFDHTSQLFDGSAEDIVIAGASDLAEECAFAAAKALEFVRAGCRFKDIAVVSPNWNLYDSHARGIFSKFGVPINLTEKSDILGKPVMAVILSALDLISDNWDYVNVFKYLKTGMADISEEECDILENYVIKWSVRGESMWAGSDEWTMHPGGYSEEMTESEAQELKFINSIRKRIAQPVTELSDALNSDDRVISYVRSVYTFMEQIGLYAKIKEKAEYLISRNMRTEAEEYLQLWDIMVSALQQFADIVGENHMNRDEFIKLLKLVLSQYKVGTIPTSVDSVKAGDLSRVRPRGIKHLIVLGATDDALPGRSASTGVFSDSEREKLRELGLELMDDEDDLVARELMAVYNSFTLPSQTLSLLYPTGSRRSYILMRIMKLFLMTESIISDEIYTAAKLPCFELAASKESGTAKKALKYFSLNEEWNEKLNAVYRASSMPRGRLSHLTALRLYGNEINVSASRIDKYYSCRFSYFLHYGLRAKARSKAGLDAPETGTFMHFILERAAREADRKGGFSNVSDAEIKKMVPEFIREYADKKLGGLNNKSGRFKYLFGRLSSNAVSIVLNMAEELRNSKFKPIDFELKFSRAGDMEPVKISDGENDVCVNGIVDRVDGWIKDDKLYLRVIDYKTGKKALNLSDIWHGMGMQMLIYLFALQKYGDRRYDREIVPAGVLYAPARDVLTQAPHDLSDDELSKETLKNHRRSGLLLCDEDVIEAMESREAAQKLLPVKFTKDGKLFGDSLASLEQLGMLSRVVDKLISDMGRELHSGAINADPYYRGQIDNACVYCDYFEACHFNDGIGGDKVRYLSKLKTPEFWSKVEEAGK